jgi:hypothetical protein
MADSIGPRRRRGLGSGLGGLAAHEKNREFGISKKSLFVAPAVIVSNEKNRPRSNFSRGSASKTGAVNLRLILYMTHHAGLSLLVIIGAVLGLWARNWYLGKHWRAALVHWTPMKVELIFMLVVLAVLVMLGTGFAYMHLPFLSADCETCARVSGLHPLADETQ